MKRRLLTGLLLGGLLTLSAGAQTASWDGRYVHEAVLGRTAGGTAMVIEYEITLRSQAAQCQLTISGFQTDETLLCTAKAQGNSLALHFKSHEDGRLVNAHGVAVYTPGALLLTLERPATGPLITRWHALRGQDGRTPAPGPAFALATRPSR